MSEKIEIEMGEGGACFIHKSIGFEVRSDFSDEFENIFIDILLPKTKGVYSVRRVSFLPKRIFQNPYFFLDFSRFSRSNKIHLNTASLNENTLNNQFISHKLTYFIVL